MNSAHITHVNVKPRSMATCWYINGHSSVYRDAHDGSGPTSVFFTTTTVEKDPIFTCISQLSRERRRFRLHQAHIQNPHVRLHNSVRDNIERERIFHHQKWKWTIFILTKTRFSLCSPQWLHGLRHNKQTKVYPRGASQAGTIHSA